MKCKYCQKDVATQADYDTIPEGEGDHLCWSDFGERCIDAEEAMDNARAEIDTLKRQLEVLAKEFSKHGRCAECQARHVCLHSASGITCKDSIKQWSLEQAKKGGE